MSMGLIHPMLDTAGRTIQSPDPQNADKSVTIEGLHFLALAGVDTSAQLKFTETFELFGVDFAVDLNASWGDYAKLEVVDVDNILGGGAGAILGNFGTQIMLAPNMSKTWEFASKKDIPINIYLRVTYTNTGTSNVNMCLNFLGRA